MSVNNTNGATEGGRKATSRKRPIIVDTFPMLGGGQVLRSPLAFLTRLRLRQIKTSFL